MTETWPTSFSSPGNEVVEPSEFSRAFGCLHVLVLNSVCFITLLMGIVVHSLLTKHNRFTEIKTKLTLLIRWLYHGALGDSVLSPLLFSASDRNFSKCSSRLSKYGDRAEINKNTSYPVTTSIGIVMTTAIKGGACVVTQ